MLKLQPQGPDGKSDYRPEQISVKTQSVENEDNGFNKEEIS